MKLVRHTRRPPDRESSALRRYQVVWLSKTLELRFKAGDSSAAVARVVAKHWPVKQKEAERIVEFWKSLDRKMRIR